MEAHPTRGTAGGQVLALFLSTVSIGNQQSTIGNHCTRVMAPSDAEETSAAYLANTPALYRGSGSRQLANLYLISSSASSTSRRRFSISNTTTSPSATAAI